MKAIAEVLHLGPPLTKANKALILLHGRGGTAEGLLSLAELLCDESFYIMAPQATKNIWYPFSFMEETSQNEPYLSQSIKEIKELIDQTAEYIPKEYIFLVGFSQGACLSTEISSRYATKYGGIAAFTGGLIGKNIDISKYKGNFQGTKVFISNGNHDPYIPLSRTEETQEIMNSLGANVTLRIYEERPHMITEDEISFVKSNIFS